MSFILNNSSIFIWAFWLDFQNPSELLPGLGLFSYLLTNLLTELLTEGNFTMYTTAYGIAYRIKLFYLLILLQQPT